MAAKTCGCPHKSYKHSSALGLFSSIFSGFISLLKDIDKIFEPPVLSKNHIPVPDTLSLHLSIAKYTKKDLQHIFKIILEVQALT